MKTVLFSLLCLLAVPPALGSIDELSPYISDMSENLYYSLFKDTNHSVYGNIKDSEFLNKGHIDNFRRFSVWTANSFWSFAIYDKNTNAKVCSSMRYVYRGSLDFIYRYYNIRALYANTREYEIGYLCHQIVYRYQVMIETYHIVIQKFVKRPDERVLTISPFFYFYTNMIEQAQLIVHYVNMLEISARKYRGVTNPTWPEKRTQPRATHTGQQKSAEDEAAGPRTTLSASGEREAYKAWEKQRIKDMKDRKKAAKANKQKIDMGQVVPTKPTHVWSKRTHGYWWNDYGWSIENW